jgi:hypothetical protein
MIKEKIPQDKLAGSFPLSLSNNFANRGRPDNTPIKPTVETIIIIKDQSSQCVIDR